MSIATRFDFESTAAEVVDGIDLTGRRAIVTGGASGIGIPTARALAGAGAEVTLAVRDPAAGARVAGEIEGDMRVARLDLADLASVREFAAAWDGPLHMLINNAGVMALPELTLNRDGHELQFATNHLGHFALTLGLHTALAAAEGARVVCVSSAGHLRSPVVFDDLDFAFRDYDPFAAYAQSKTANVLHAVELTRRWADEGIVANALMPGGIATRLQRHQDARYMDRARAQMRIKSPEQGAATSVLLATAPQLDGVGGRYFEDCHEVGVIHRRDKDVRHSHGVAAFAVDPDNAYRLWEVSSRLVNA
jgi:NAD(P)-dependent dehydrogenase (short-subunit alcohol dehydrogenase family)